MDAVSPSKGLWEPNTRPEQSAAVLLLTGSATYCPFADEIRRTGPAGRCRLRLTADLPKSLTTDFDLFFLSFFFFFFFFFFNSRSNSEEFVIEFVLIINPTLD